MRGERCHRYFLHLILQSRRYHKLFDIKIHKLFQNSRSPVSFPFTSFSCLYLLIIWSLSTSFDIHLTRFGHVFYFDTREHYIGRFM